MRIPAVRILIRRDAVRSLSPGSERQSTKPRMNAEAGRLDSAYTVVNPGSSIHKHDGSTPGFGLELGRFLEALVIRMACI
jgi:hypothetical protein